MITVKTLPKTKLTWLKKDYLLITLLGLVFLTMSHLALYQGASLSDEVIYAVVARNVYEQQTLNTTVYRLDSIIQQGYPTRDHHMPGYPLTLAAVFAIFGVNNGFAIGLPSYIAYLLTGLIFYSLGKSLFNATISFWATLLFYIYPVSFVTASLILVESSLNLIAVIFLAYWLKINRADLPKLFDAAILAALIILGMAYRETFVIFLPPALFIVLKPCFVRKNYRPIAMFGFMFIVLFLSVFWPLTQHRGSYPRPFFDALEAVDFSALFAVVSHYLSLTAVPVDAHYYAAILNLVLGIVITGLSLFFVYRKSPTASNALSEPPLKSREATNGYAEISFKAQKNLVFLFIYLFWSAMLILTTVHAPLFDWATPRHMFTFLLPGLLLFVAAMFQIKQLVIRYTVLATVVMVMGISSLLLTQQTMAYQYKTIYHQQRISSIVEKYLKSYNPQTIMVYKGFTVAWDHYPLTVVMFFPNSYEEIKILEERLPLDVIVVNNERERDIILDASTAGLLTEPYVSLFPYKVEDFYFLIKEPLFVNSLGSSR